jgi:ubiquinone/menaquinone biosynthesis C-methylase UbiE
MGHVYSYNEAKAYERWQKKPGNQADIRREHQLMTRMLAPLRGESVLDIGCGTGMTMMALLEMGLRVSGIDPSPDMLDIAGRNVGRQAELHRGVAEELPFDDNQFTYSAITNTLEFVEDPLKALEEVFRVTKDRVFIGFLNRHSTLVSGIRAQRVFIKNLYSDARFFSVWELKRMIRDLLGDVPVTWRSLSRFPHPLGPFRRSRAPLHLFCKLPVAPFVGVCVTLVPRFRTRPLRLKCRTKIFEGTLTGLASVQWRPHHGSTAL